MYFLIKSCNFLVKCLLIPVSVGYTALGQYNWVTGSETIEVLDVCMCFSSPIIGLISRRSCYRLMKVEVSLEDILKIE
jgi:hypothetical protein